MSQGPKTGVNMSHAGIDWLEGGVLSGDSRIGVQKDKSGLYHEHLNVRLRC